MKLLRTEILFDHVTNGGVPPAWINEVRSDIAEAVEAIKWPPHSGIFTLNPTLKGNGVPSIKEAFQKVLEKNGWNLEHRMSLGKGISPGPIDAVRRFDAGLVGIEWETGNISSSHRSLNRMALGIMTGNLIAGVLVLPSRAMYRFLTDRIGNYQEIEPYFPVWRALETSRQGFLAVVEVEHDATAVNVPLISKGTDGRALI